MYTPEHWLYLALCAYFVLPWLVCYRLRPDLRPEMLLMGLVGAMLAPVVDTIIMRDWWHPLTLGQGPIHAESLLFGFFSIGLTAVMPQVLGRTKTRKGRRVYQPVPVHLLAGVVGALGLVFGLNRWGGVNSSLTTLLGSGFLAACVATRRPDLLVPMATAALGTVLVALPGYWLITGFVQPDWFARAWHLENLSGYWLLGLPVEEVLWYAGTGAAFGTALKCLRGDVLVPMTPLVVRVTFPSVAQVDGATVRVS